MAVAIHDKFTTREANKKDICRHKLNYSKRNVYEECAVDSEGGDKWDSSGGDNGGSGSRDGCGRGDDGIRKWW